MQVRILTRYCLRDFSRYVLNMWLVIFLVGDGISLLFRLLFPRGTAVFIMDGPPVAPIAIILAVCLAAHVRRYVDMGFAGGVSRRGQWQALTLTVLGGSLLAEVGAALWSAQMQLHLIGGKSSAMLRALGYSGPWNWGVALSNVLLEWGLIVIVLSAALLIGLMVLYLVPTMRWLIGGVVVAVGLLQFLIRNVPGTSTALALIRRIANGVFGVNQGINGTPYLLVALVLGADVLLLALCALGTRRTVVFQN